jgi:membrane protease YdiL (CAAX protease family)
VLTVPFWSISSLLGNKLPIPINLPISMLAFVNPVIAASILSYRRYGAQGVKELLKRNFDYRRTEKAIWHVPTLLLVPLVYFLSFVIMVLVGSPLPETVDVPFLLTPILFALFFVGAACEELGWSGYAIDPLQNRWGALAGAIIVGLVWQAWHLIGDVQASRTMIWILWHSLLGIATRVLMVWIYNNTGKSVFSAILVHVTDNVGWVLFPNFGSHYDPFFPFIITAAMAAMVTFVWGPKTLSRFRYATAVRK